MPKPNDIRRIVRRFRSTKVLVIGDVMLDCYVRGEVDRISPEAPVQVVKEREREFALGGAGNVARNIAALGGRVTLIGLIGNDDAAKRVLALCRRARVTPELIADRRRPTPLKTRIMARNQQLLRVDRESERSMPPAIERELIELIGRLPRHDMVAISDYAKAVMTPRVIAALQARYGGGRIIADLKPVHAGLYRSLAAVTPNLNEAEALTGIYGDTPSRAARAARALGRQFLSSVVLTRGEHGMTVYDKVQKEVTHIPSEPRRVFDVSGAGDTVVAALALLLAKGAPLADAAVIANAAGGIVVEKVGTATVAPEELGNHFINHGRAQKLRKVSR